MRVLNKRTIDEAGRDFLKTHLNPNLIIGRVSFLPKRNLKIQHSEFFKTKFRGGHIGNSDVINISTKALMSVTTPFYAPVRLTYQVAVPETSRYPP